MSEASTADPAATTRSSDVAIPEWLSLDDDEEVLWMGEPSIISVIGTIVWGVVLLVVLVGALILLGVPLQYLSIKNTDYVITNKAIYVKTGILSTTIENVGLDRIQNTEYSRSFWGKRFDYGTIDISTAGSSGAEITLRSIRDAREVRELITERSNTYAGGADRSSTEPSPDAAPTADATTETNDAERTNELLSELRATRQALEAVEEALREQHVPTEGDDEPSKR